MARQELEDRESGRLPNGQIPEWSGPQDHEMAEGYTLPTQGIVGGSQSPHQPILDNDLATQTRCVTRPRLIDKSNCGTPQLTRQYQEEAFHDPTMCNE